MVCGTVYGDTLYKDILGSTASVGYCIPTPDFYLVLHGIDAEKALDGLINQLYV